MPNMIEGICGLVGFGAAALFMFALAWDTVGRPADTPMPGGMPRGGGWAGAIPYILAGCAFAVLAFGGLLMLLGYGR